MSFLCMLAVFFACSARTLSRPILESSVLVIGSLIIFAASGYEAQTSHVSGKYASLRYDPGAWLLSTRAIIGLGDISYEIYILQFPIGILIFSIVPSSLPTFLLYVVSLISSAALLNSFTRQIESRIRDSKAWERPIPQAQMVQS
jgi:peptidoglycan/LPS O-acetylase OafA/YrhL